ALRGRGRHARPIEANYIEVENNGYNIEVIKDEYGRGLASFSDIKVNQASIKENTKFGIYVLGNFNLNQVNFSNNKKGGIWYAVAPIQPESVENIAASDQQIAEGVDYSAYTLQDIQQGFEIPVRNASSIHGSVIENNEGNGIYLDHDAALSISKSNIIGNSAYAVNNQAPNALIDAQNNWWGDAAGPTAGTLNGNIDAGSWLEIPVALVASSAIDTLFLPIGAVDSVTIFFQNWEKPDDMIDVVITDSLGWLGPDTTFTLTFPDSMGADTTVFINPPAGTAIGTQNKVWVNCMSRFDVSWADRDSFQVLIYESVLDRIALSPDSVSLMPGENWQFDADGLDRHDYILPTEVVW
ncbi:hypothetical protein BVY01_01915, partial [bacterium I07]